VERGYGTERVAEQLKLLIPEAKIAIMDSDTSKNRYEDIIRDFQDGITNVLIGTQMISKGFDFDNVSTVGVLQADSMMNLPDFRAAERTYQLIAQVTGRAGRREKRGKVILQTRQPEHEAVKQLEANSYRAFFNNQMEERHLFAYPPYSRITTIKLKGKYANKVEAVAESLCCILRKHFGEDSILGPDAPMVSKVNMLHIRSIIMKIDHKINYIQTRQMIDYALSCIKTEIQNQDIRISFDVDPL
jgi:primosomal protein N' (replication factor Y)